VRSSRAFQVADQYLEAWRCVHGPQPPSVYASTLWPQMIQVGRTSPQLHADLVALDTDDQVAVLSHVRLAYRIEKEMSA
jgi:hypothetical protein